MFSYFDKFKNQEINIIYNKKPKDLYFSFKENLKNYRFEKLLVQFKNSQEIKLEKWFLSCKNFKIKNFIFLAGAQNIKMFLLENKQIEKAFVPPAVVIVQYLLELVSMQLQIIDKNNINKNKYIKSIDNMYLGYQLLMMKIKNYF